MRDLISNLLINDTKTGAPRKIAEWAMIIAMYFAVALLLFTLSFSYSPVSGESMMPTIKDKQHALLNRWDAEYSRGEIIVFNVGENLLIKRIIGVAGDKIEFRYKNDNIHVELYRNDVKLEESYINEEMTDWWMHAQYVNAYGTNIGLNSPVIVPENSLCVLGDNRNHSLDSRVMYEQVDHSVELGFVKKSEVVGSVAFLVPQNTVIEWLVRLIFGDLWEVREKS